MAAAGVQAPASSRSTSWSARCHRSSSGRRPSRPCCSRRWASRCNLRTVVELVWFDDIKSGNFDLAIGAVVSTLLDPSDYFNAWYKKDGPQNYRLLGQRRSSTRCCRRSTPRSIRPKRLALIRKAETIMEQDPPVLPGRLGEDQRRLVQLREGPQSEGILRHLRLSCASTRSGSTSRKASLLRLTGEEDRERVRCCFRLSNDAGWLSLTRVS